MEKRRLLLDKEFITKNKRVIIYVTGFSNNDEAVVASHTCTI